MKNQVIEIEKNQRRKKKGRGNKGGRKEWERKRP